MSMEEKVQYAYVFAIKYLSIVIKALTWLAYKGHMIQVDGYAFPMVAEVGISCNMVRLQFAQALCACSKNMWI